MRLSVLTFACAGGIMLAACAAQAQQQTFTGQAVLATPGTLCGKITVGDHLVAVQWADGFVAQGLWATMLHLEGETVVVTTDASPAFCYQDTTPFAKVLNIGRK